MTLSETSIKRPVFAWMLMFGLIVFGGISFMRMGISQLPDVDYPVVSVNIRLEGAAPEVIETSIVDIIEDAVMTIQSIRSVTSQSEDSEGTVTIEFELNRDIDLAVQDVQAKVSSVLQKLPKEITSPTIRKSNPEDQPIMLLTLESDKYPLKDLMSYTNDRIKDQFSTVAGVGDITLGGYRDPNLRIWVDGKTLNFYALSVNDVISTIQNEHMESPAGQLQEGTQQLNVRTMGEAKTIEEFGNLIVNQRGGQPNYTPLHLNQVARIEDGMADALSFSRAMGTPGVALNILKQRGSNAVAVAKAVRAKVAEVQKGLPEGMKLSINFDSTRYIEQAVRELNFTLLLSALLTGLVCWMFLGSWSSTLNVLLAIPTSVVGTFIVLYFAGFTLNTFTLLGLSLSIGIVVDDAIMVLENIIRHQEKGKSRILAALVGSQEITFAAMAATISVVAIFLPVAFMSGVIGKFFFQFGVTITVAVLLSLLEALTLTPMRCSQFVNMGKRTTRFGKGVEWVMNKTRDLYAGSLKIALKHRMMVIVAALIVFALSFSALMFLNKEFIPSEDQSRFNIRLKTPVGSALSYSDSKFSDVEKFLSKRPEVDRYVLRVGGGSPGDSNSGSVLVTMKDKGKRGIDLTAGHELSQMEFMDVCRKSLKKIPDVSVVIQDLSTRAFTASRGFPVEFTVQGPDWDKLARYSKQIMDGMEKTGLMTDLDTNYSLGQPELHVVPDRKKATEYGVSIASISQVVEAMIGGVQVGTYEKGGHRYDIRVKLEETKEDPGAKINNLFVRNNRGELTPLSNLVTMERKKSMVSIWRSNRERSITIYANVKAGESQQKALLVAQDIAKRLLPPEYHIAMTGSSQTFAESLQSLVWVLLLGIIVAYMVLASQFNSFIDPLSVLMALPFSISGALMALYIAHRSINIYSVIGLILLMGIVKKNSILLVDFTNQVRAREELSVSGALLKACPIRLRPILMTSVATIAGAVPAALAFGPGAESRNPMAIAVIGGVIFSTALTLFVVPCFYSAMSRFEGKEKHEKLLSDALEERIKQANGERECESLL
ncbi:MAG: efflux RND transporter permease subunit [Candidatus Omnitrophica bacterium]|nr:efflux RND transporter permease subunit [Candidatus Omnitrophota bacterium]